MRVREVVLADGRRLWFYEFDDELGAGSGEPPASPGPAPPAAPGPPPDEPSR